MLKGTAKEFRKNYRLECKIKLDTWIEAASGRDCREALPLLGRLLPKPRFHRRRKRSFTLVRFDRQNTGGFYGQ